MGVQMIVSAEYEKLLNEYAEATAEEMAAINAVIPAAQFGMEAALAATKRMEDAHEKKMKLYNRLRAISLNKG
jgi:hypothetical protein